ncbi:hypothetical protein NKL07_01280 [Mesorhizobium sp. C280B]|uniref:hypothetical protein n=1 Tax=Mesorhizobium sp. C280B TaxID=2956828 RepID=UPI00333DEBA7
MPIPTLPRAAKSSAPAQYLGFSLQQVRLCYYLLSVADGIAVSLEHIDDVGVHRPDGTALFEQAKSTLSGKNPASNKSEELWKTFGNWADTCLDSNIDPSTSEFRYYVSDTKAGALLTAISKADSPAEAEKVLKKLRSSSKNVKRERGVSHISPASSRLGALYAAPLSNIARFMRKPIRSPPSVIA